MILAFASAAHGNNMVSKGVLMAATTVVYSAVGLLSLGWLGTFAGLIALAWWFTFRRGHQAKLELDVMDTINPPHPRLREVLAAHYYIGWMTCLGLRLFNYSSPLGKKLGWNNGKFWDCRRPTEFLTGLTGDIIILTILALGA